MGSPSSASVLCIAESWGSLSKHKPLIDNILHWPGATAPKLPSEPPGDWMTGGSIGGKNVRRSAKHHPTSDFGLNFLHENVPPFVRCRAVGVPSVRGDQERRTGWKHGREDRHKTLLESDFVEVGNDWAGACLQARLINHKFEPIVLVGDGFLQVSKGN